VTDRDIVATEIEKVPLDAEEATSLPVTFETDGLQTDQYSVRCCTDDGTSAEFVSVISEPYDVEITDITSPGEDGDDIDAVDVIAVVTNAGDFAETQPVQFTVEDELIGTETVHHVAFDTTLLKRAINRTNLNLNG
jgi:hypothetical protein